MSRQAMALSVVALVAGPFLGCGALTVVSGAGPRWAGARSVRPLVAAERCVALKSAAVDVAEADTAEDFAVGPDLLDDPFGGAAGSGDEDLLASFDLENADVGEIMEWGQSGREESFDRRIVDRESFGRHAKDCGSPEVQIAMFTTRIKFVTKHVIENPKDHASRRGLLALVSKRRRLLHYYFSKKPLEAEKLVNDLGVRFRFRNQMPSRTEKYRQYTIKENKKKK